MIYNIFLFKQSLLLIQKQNKKYSPKRLTKCPLGIYCSKNENKIFQNMLKRFYKFQILIKRKGLGMFVTSTVFNEFSVCEKL